MPKYIAALDCSVSRDASLLQSGGLKDLSVPFLGVSRLRSTVYRVAVKELKQSWYNEATPLFTSNTRLKLT